MAEAIVTATLGEVWQAYSAGTRPTGYVHPLAIQVLREVGIEHRGRSKSVEELQHVSFDLVVTVCDSAAEECPLWLGVGRRVHLGFPDPAKASSSEEAIIAAFRAVRDDIVREIPSLLAEDT
jgi:arsenate reductase